MNTPDRHRPPVQPDPAEWAAQERAIAAERSNTDPASHDQRIAQYRLIARALRHPPLDPVPFGFAARVAGRVGAPPRSADERLERLLLRGLLGLLGASGTVVSAMYGASWVRAVLAAMPDRSIATLATTANWGLVLLACVGLSWALERLCRREVGSTS